MTGERSGTPEPWFQPGPEFGRDGLLFPGTLLAWRSWRVVETADGSRLASPVAGDLWTPGTRFEASCRATAGAQAPCPDHGCGVYAIRRPLPALLPEVGVVGRVALWGRVIEHERGFRAAYAYPVALVGPSSPSERRRVARLAASYGCELG